MADNQQDTTQAATSSATAAPASSLTTSLTEAAKNGATSGFIPADVLKTYPSLSKFKEPAALAKSYGELEKMVGGSVRIPGENATEEERKTFHSKLGVPETPDKYELKFPEGVNIDENLVGSFRGVAHQLGITPNQAQALASWFTEQAQGMAEGQSTAQAAEREKWTSELKSELGYQYNRTTALAAQTLATIVEGNKDDPLVKWLDESGMGDHPLMVKFFAKLGERLGEDKFLDEPKVPDEDTILNAKEEKAKILMDPKHPYWKGDAASVERVKKLNDLIFSAESSNG